MQSPVSPGDSGSKVVFDRHPQYASAIRAALIGIDSPKHTEPSQVFFWGRIVCLKRRCRQHKRTRILHEREIVGIDSFLFSNPHAMSFSSISNLPGPFFDHLEGGCFGWKEIEGSKSKKVEEGPYCLSHRAFGIVHFRPQNRPLSSKFVQNRPESSIFVQIRPLSSTFAS